MQESFVSLQHIYKVYPNGIEAVHDFNLDIKEKEFIVIVGPSGCGKSTTLRMVAGLEDITTGDLFIDSKRCNEESPKDRNIAMVFQSYSLYPHMTVRENISFGLRMKRNPSIPSDEIERRTMETAKLLDLTDYLDRKPAELSGGQRQRVALGRAIIRDAKLFLMDEPLSNLDAKLRGVMRSEIINLHKKLNSTVIYVTHDQTEAMTMADRIVVMKDGYIQQIASPQEIYSNPANTFVANFIGSPAMNIIKADFDGKNVMFGNGLKIPFKKDRVSKMNSFYKQSVEEYKYLYTLLDTSLEECFISLVPFFRKSLFKERILKKDEIFSYLKKPIVDFYGKIIDCNKILFLNPSIAGKEASEIKKAIANDLKQIKQNNAENPSDFTYFRYKTFNKIVADNIDSNSNKFNVLLGLINDLIKDTNKCSTTKEAALLLLKRFASLYQNSKKNCYQNVEKEVNELLKAIKDNQLAKKQLNLFLKKTSNVVSLSDADIRKLYFTAVKCEGSNEISDWILSLVDKSIKNRKVEDKLRNEYVIEQLINSVILTLEDELANPKTILFGIRPEDIHVATKENKNKYKGIEFNFDISLKELLGKNSVVHLSVDDKQELITETLSSDVENDGNTLRVIFDEEKIKFFDSITERSIF